MEVAALIDILKEVAPPTKPDPVYCPYTTVLSSYTVLIQLYLGYCTAQILMNMADPASQDRLL